MAMMNNLVFIIVRFYVNYSLIGTPPPLLVSFGFTTSSVHEEREKQTTNVRARM